MSQIPNRGNGNLQFGIENWDLFGIWNLGLVILQTYVLRRPF
jgi:hypothetical protein